ncbi:MULTISPECIES: tripartite tricarboxylate transporter substrate-binding protein [unclassified Beijerinckia]|uniref:Bug family tripartite tricarboxylate transporter substrate binding protein n=1 Tax=unclassified Beijerinckia TaxID=2638183 RepID=UPI000895DF5B|nr:MULTISPECIES: tripartite tricarboxylate transporter substrate-binding protein [unclassified Beijerinckia]MDH7796725.1 tripartite-type tricarboxylate transporter receptor subunit TctC [Beijerinckia sp. GAS462]SEC57313.1 Tripartite-type tricarboxylate transporter, receptor component TctC [Beijerinckia sp. 28-YEA-48]
MELVRRISHKILIACALCVWASIPAKADAMLEFYQGKTVRLVNGGAAGSGYDLYSRMLAPYLEKKLGAKVIVDSRPGAGMMIAMNHVWIQPPDGLTIMLAPGEGAVLGKLIDDGALRFDLMKYGLLARVNTAPRVLIVYPKSSYYKVDDLLKQSKPLEIGANGKTDAASDTSAVMCHALKLNCKITIGYKSSADFALAAVRGEVDGTVLVEDSAARYSQGGQLRGVLVTARERSRLMPDVPTIYEATKLDPEAQWWLDFREDIRKIGRILVVPPGMDQEKLAFLRKVTKEILTDPEALKDFEKQQQPALFGEPGEIAELMRRSLDGLSPERRQEVKHVIADKYY